MGDGLSIQVFTFWTWYVTGDNDASTNYYIFTVFTVSATHGDYFIKAKFFKKSELTKHCSKFPDKELIILFPEGLLLFCHISRVHTMFIRRVLSSCYRY